MPNTRLPVAQALCKMQKAEAWSNLVLDHMIVEHKMDARDSAFAGALFYGVLERLLTLDACIAAHCNVKLKKLSLPVLAALRMGVYQLLYMDSVPDSAAVNESVAVVKAMHQQKSAGLVNAVLRSFLRDDKGIPLPKDRRENLAVAYSCPAPLIRMWEESYGEAATQRLLDRSLTPPPLYIRVNSRRITDTALTEQLEAQGITVAATDLNHCLLLKDAGTVANIPAYKEGLFHVQDKSSQICAMALDVAPGMTVLDACSAPGGKAFTLAQMMEDTGKIIAADLHAHRVGLVEQRAGTMGLHCIQAVEADMTAPLRQFVECHRVLCDVPCSGLGVIARKPELKYKSLEEFSSLPDLQYKILANTAQYCKEKGLVIYSTCTLHPTENEAVVERFLSEHADFALEPSQATLGEGMHTFLGEDTDGFFIARLRRI